MFVDLNPAKGLIFRISHRDNLPWILEHGLTCKTTLSPDPNFVSIGNADLIDKRSHRQVPIHPGGTLSDYIPFYFTPKSPMLYNIKTGWGGITRRLNDDIVMIVSSIPRLVSQGIPFVFTDRHAYLTIANFFSDPSDLTKIDWGILQQKDFRRDPDNPEKVERYQAEALVHGHLPVSGILGIACYTSAVESAVQVQMRERGVTLRTVVKQGWYFR